MNDATRKFLTCCYRHGIKAVVICMAHPMVKASTTFHPGTVPLSVFAEGEDPGGMPAIWRACDEAGVAGRCGNHDQHQLREGHGLEPGAYQKSNCRWRKIA